jgi:hypothetical protein
VADQQRIINSNALLLQALQTQQDNSQLERGKLGQVQAQHISLQAEHVRVQRSLVESERLRNERVEACNAFEEEVTALHLESEALQVKTDFLMGEKKCQKKKDVTARSKRTRMKNEW